MSVRQRLADSGIIEKATVQQSTGTVTCTVQTGASIYVQRNDHDFEVLHRALSNGKFPNSAELLAYAKENHWKTIRNPSSPLLAYRLGGEHIDSVIDIIRRGRA